MNYSVGSVADLISGNDTPNKPKVVEKNIVKTHLQVNNKGQSEQNKLKSKKLKSNKIKTPKIERNNINEIPNKNTVKAVSKKNNNDFSEKKVRDFEQEGKTIFVGNVPLEASKLKLKKLFGKFGPIESIRLRCAAPEDPNVSKKLAIITKRFNPNRKSLHCFIRYQNKEDAYKSLEMNSFVYKKNHLRVNMSQNEEKPDESKALFVGNIPFDAEEEDLWMLFEPFGAISSVRLVRDPRTSMGKGFGYVNFQTIDAVELALEKDEIKLKNRVLRIKRCNISGSKKKNEKNRKKPRTLKITEKEEGEPKKLKSVPIKNTVFQGVKALTKKKKKLDKTSKRRKIISNILTSKGKKPETKQQDKDPYTLKIFY